MMNLRRLRIVVSILAGMSLVLAAGGCKVTTMAARSIVGEWKFDAAKSVLPANLKMTCQNLNYDFRADGTYSSDPDESGVYTVNGDTVLVQPTKLAGFKFNRDTSKNESWTLSSDGHGLTRAATGPTDVIALKAFGW